MGFIGFIGFIGFRGTLGILRFEVPYYALDSKASWLLTGKVTL